MAVTLKIPEAVDPNALVGTVREHVAERVAKGKAGQAALRQTAEGEAPSTPLQVALAAGSVVVGSTSLGAVALSAATGEPIADGGIGAVPVVAKAVKDGIGLVGKAAAGIGAALPEAAGMAAETIGKLAAPEVTIPLTAVQLSAAAVDWAKHHQPDTPEQILAKGGAASDATGVLDAAATGINAVRTAIEHAVTPMAVPPRPMGRGGAPRSALPSGVPQTQTTPSQPPQAAIPSNPAEQTGFGAVAAAAGNTGRVPGFAMPHL